MTKVTYISTGGVETIVDAKDGDSLMQTAVNNSVDGIVGECGGSMMCATCHVYVDEAFFNKLPPVSDSEDEMLDNTLAERRQTSRLSCQIEIGSNVEGIVVYMPEEQQ